MEIEVSEELWEMINQCLELGFAAVNEDGTFIPYAIFDSEDGLGMKNYLADDIQSTLDVARADIKSMSVNTYAIGYAGAVGQGLDKQSAVFIEAAEEGTDSAFMFVHCYKHSGQAGKLEPIDKMAFVGKCLSAFQLSDE